MTLALLPQYVGPWLAQPSPSRVDAMVTGLNAAFASTAVLGITAPAGMYRVSMLCSVDTVGTAGTVRLQVACTARSGSVIYSLPAHDVTNQGLESGLFIVESAGSGDMLLSAIFAAVTIGSLSYSYRITVDQVSKLG